MKQPRMIVGIVLIVVGIVMGLVVALLFFRSGLDALKQGDTIRGLLHIMLWAELCGLAAGLAFLIPGVWLLRSLDTSRTKLTARRPDPPEDSRSKQPTSLNQPSQQ